MDAIPELNKAKAIDIFKWTASLAGVIEIGNKVPETSIG